MCIACMGNVRMVNVLQLLLSALFVWVILTVPTLRFVWVSSAADCHASMIQDATVINVIMGIASMMHIFDPNQPIFFSFLGRAVVFYHWSQHKMGLNIVSPNKIYIYISYLYQTSTKTHTYPSPTVGTKSLSSTSIQTGTFGFFSRANRRIGVGWLDDKQTCPHGNTCFSFQTVSSFVGMFVLCMFLVNT